jgi:hypothetical protein
VNALPREQRAEKTTSELLSQNAYTNNAKKNGYAFGIGNYALRVWVAMRLAKDVETCCALLRGEAVDPACLDGGELEFMCRRRLVRMDFLAVDAVADSLRRHRLIELVREPLKDAA